MKPRSRFGARVGLVAGMILGAWAGQASAGPVTALTTFDGSGVPIVGAKFDGHGETVYAGAMTTTIWEGTTVLANGETSYCVDFVDNLRQTVMPASLSVVSGVVTAAGTGHPFDRNLGAAGWLLAHIQPTTAVERGALQVAIWEAIYDFASFTSGSASLASGLFQLTSGYDTATLRPLAASYLDAAWDPLAQAFRTAPVSFLRLDRPQGGPFSQDQIFRAPPEVTDQVAAVPEPRTAIAAVLGTVVAATWLRFRRRAAAPTS